MFVKFISQFFRQIIVLTRTKLSWDNKIFIVIDTAVFNWQRIWNVELPFFPLNQQPVRKLTVGNLIIIFVESDLLP
jgi:hypothetical protein